MKKRILSISIALVMALTVFVTVPDTASAKGGKYWLKVNTKANVVNVYKKSNGKWKPYKVMLCSCGRNGTPTPKGSYKLKKKWRWHMLMGGVYGQYVTQINGNYLFHSVLYTGYKKSSKCSRYAYNRLGKKASHGCVRLATMDAKWIYKNCKRGTKVTVYSSDKAGPLGKPKRVAMPGKGKYGWDPTYDSKKNKHFMLKGPVITINKADTIAYGKTFSIKAGVKARSPYTYENLTSKVKVKKVEYSSDGASFSKVSNKKVNTKRPGFYRITYSCYDKYCGRNTVTKQFVLTVKPKDAEDANINKVGDPAENEGAPAAGEKALSESQAADPTNVTEPADQDAVETDPADVTEPDDTIPSDEVVAPEDGTIPDDATVPSEVVDPTDESAPAPLE